MYRTVVFTNFQPDGKFLVYQTMLQAGVEERLALQEEGQIYTEGGAVTLSRSGEKYIRNKKTLKKNVKRIKTKSNLSTSRVDIDFSFLPFEKRRWR